MWDAPRTVIRFFFGGARVGAPATQGEVPGMASSGPLLFRVVTCRLFQARFLPRGLTGTSAPIRKYLVCTVIRLSRCRGGFFKAPQESPGYLKFSISPLSKAGEAGRESMGAKKKEKSRYITMMYRPQKG